MKRVVCLCIALLCLCATALAGQDALVMDRAGLLTEEERTALETQAAEISQRHTMDVLLLTVERLNGKTPLDYAADEYDANGWGRGENHDGVLYLISMEERQMTILTTGSAIQAFTDYGQDAILDDIQSDVSAGLYADAFARFLKDADIFITQYESGAPYDVDNEVELRSVGERLLGASPIALLVALIATIVTMLVMKSGMRTAVPQRGANRYVVDGSMQMRRTQDIFLYHTQTRRKIETESSGKSGGSSTFTSSSGETHGGSSRGF